MRSLINYPLVTALSASSLLLLAASASAQVNDPLPAPIDQESGLIVVSFDEFARLPDIESGEPRTLLQVIQDKNAEQGRAPAARADMRFGTGTDNQFFILNKHDGVIRLLK